MDIYAKSILSRDQLDSKINIGCDGIEIQLTNELIDLHTTKYKTIYQAFDLKQFNNYPIRAIHAPLIKGFDTNIEQLCDLNGQFLFYNICELAEYFGELQNRDIIVVIHTEERLDHLKTINNILNNILLLIDKGLKLFPHIKMAIENVPPIDFIDQNIRLRNNVQGENIILVNYIKEQLNTNRVGTVLDTCHAIITKIYMEPICKIIGVEKDFSMKHYFEINKNDIMLVHLANVINNGYGDNHGTVFENPEDCFKILDLYNEFNYKCPVTLEVREKDYLINNNYRLMKQLVDKYLCM